MRMHTALTIGVATTEGLCDNLRRQWYQPRLIPSMSVHVEVHNLAICILNAIRVHVLIIAQCCSHMHGTKVGYIKVGYMHLIN